MRHALSRRPDSLQCKTSSSSVRAFSLALSSAQKKMAEHHPNIAPPPSKEDLDNLSTSELISFLEFSFRRSEFIRVAGILKCREELVKAEAFKDLSAKLSHLEAKNGSLEKELIMNEQRAQRNNEAVGKLENEITKEKGRCLLLREQYEKLKKLAQENIKALMEDIETVRVKQLELETARNERTAKIDSWKSKYSSLEAWILQLLEKNPLLIEKVRDQDMNGEKPNMDFFRMSKAAGELLRRNPASDKKESVSVIDISNSDGELIGDSFEEKSSVMSGKNCSKRKFQAAQTSGVKEVLELEEEDDVICISEMIAKKFAKG